MPANTPPERILQLSITQAFYDQHVFADPAPEHPIIANGKVVDNADFNQWWDKHEDDRQLLIGGKTMSE